MPDGYTLYGASAADFFATASASSSPQPISTAPAATGTVHETNGGNQVTDLLDAAEQAITFVTADNFGNYRFYARTGLGSLWLRPGGVGSTYYVVHPADIGQRVDDVVAQVPAEVANALSTGNPAPQYVRWADGATENKVWVRTAAQGFPTSADGAIDGDLLFMDG